MLITKTDPFTGESNTVDLPITPKQVDRWQRGELAQRVFTNLNADQREFLISGIPPGKWEEYLGPEPEE